MARFKVGDRVHVANDSQTLYVVKAEHEGRYDLLCGMPDLNDIPEELLTPAK